MNKEIIIAGFGGQGILFAGKLLAYTGMKLGKEVSWLPSYGPEMRGGTANCSVNIKDESVGSPIVVDATEVISLNLPSFLKFENAVKPGGKLFYDSALIKIEPSRNDIVYVAIPSTQMAHDMNAKNLANMIILGKFFKETNIFTLEEVFNSLIDIVPKSKPELLELNKKAILLGFEY